MELKRQEYLSLKSDGSQLSTIIGNIITPYFDSKVELGNLNLLKYKFNDPGENAETYSLSNIETVSSYGKNALSIIDSDSTKISNLTIKKASSHSGLYTTSYAIDMTNNGTWHHILKTYTNGTINIPGTSVMKNISETGVTAEDSSSYDAQSLTIDSSVVLRTNELTLNADRGWYFINEDEQDPSESNIIFTDQTHKIKIVNNNDTIETLFFDNNFIEPESSISIQNSYLNFAAKNIRFRELDTTDTEVIRFTNTTENNMNCVYIGLHNIIDKEDSWA